MEIGKRKKEKKEKDKTDVGKREMEEAGTEFPVWKRKKEKERKREQKGKRKRKRFGFLFFYHFFLIFLSFSRNSRAYRKEGNQEYYCHADHGNRCSASKTCRKNASVVVYEHDIIRL